MTSVFHNIWTRFQTIVIERGMDKMTQDEMQKALWIAAKDGNKEKIRMLVVAGADVNMEDEDGRTAMNIASQYGQAEAYKTLLAAREMQELMRAGVVPSETGQAVRKGNAQAA